MNHGLDRISGIKCRRDLPIYVGARFTSEAAALALSVAVGWSVYARSNAPLALGIIGLVQFVPALLFSLPAGEICDQFSPRPVLVAGLALQVVCALALIAVTSNPAVPIWQFYLVAFVFGAARAFSDPADQALLPLLVSPDLLPRAIAWASSAWQLAVIAGPALGGLAFWVGPGFACGVCAGVFLLALLAVLALSGRRSPLPARMSLADSLSRIGDGLVFARSHPIVLGAISLDLFAVLLGGATALLPVYARDILHAGPAGLGLLRSAPAVGAVAIALVQARYLVGGAVGLKLFLAIATFGAATVVFAFSRSFALSFAALFILGASDMVSVNIRSSIVQLATPDEMRGRVSAVNMLFIGASSELGAFESGAVASLIGTVPAVALGGIGTLAVAAIWMWAFPALRKADRLT
jgi:MFS family permease